MKTTLLLAALALSLVLLPAAEAVPAATSTGSGEARIMCQPLPDPLNGPWMLACGVIHTVCTRPDPDLCR